ncbi:MAG: 50S ribosomal protein L13 [Bdellovibrionales bacterium CG10_big_fil_rev_8_21_14_0_10_45_34]|nr:MAG: 50S ribosomal protein L13 [Bdellovibrionales bacterium CG10_big_fil_rev_8_21_14_0_10_45_34]
MSTFMANAETAERNWVLVDANSKKVGRLATQIAELLRGKNKPTFTSHVDNGDFVVVINCDKVELTGGKWDSKKYYRHSRFFGSMKETTAAEMLVKDPSFIIYDAVKGMLPKNKLSRHLLTKLKIYAGGEHPHVAQKPQLVEIKH